MIDSGNDYVCVIDSDSDIDEIVLPTSGITDPQHASSVADLPEDQSRQLEEVEMSTMLEDVDSVTLALRTSYPDMSIDPNVVFEQLEILGTCKNRVAKVVQLLIDLHAPYVSRPSVRGPDQVPSLTTAANNAMTADTNTNDQNMPQPNNLELREPAIETSHLKPEKEVYNSLLNDVQKIIEIFPYVNAEEVYAYLEARREENDRVQNVIEELIHRNPPNSEEYSFQVESYLDVDHTSIPKKRLKLTPPSSNVISSTNTFSAALIDSPPSDRQSYFVNVEPAVEEVTVLTEDTPEPCSSRPSHPVADETLSNLKMTVGESSTMDTIDRSNGDNADNVVLIENSLTSDTSVDAQVMDQFQVLKDTFPDADPDHLFTLVNEFGKDEMRLQQHVTEMLENKVYPKLKDRLEKERKQALKEKFSTNIFTPEEVLEWFDDPLTLFYDTNKPVSRNYEIHSTNQLRNDFPRLTLTSIQAAIVKHNHHYTPALRELQARQAEECSSAKYRRRKARPLLCMPEEPDELFYKELAFTKIEDELRAFLKKKHEDHEHRFNEAKNNGKLLTCNCCYDDENLHEDMIECSNGHLFCKECVRRGAEVAIGQGRTALHCMSADCATSFPLQSLQMVLKPSVFSNLLRKIQEAEISEAGIPDLVQCPFCSFAAIMPNPEDKVFRCLNPECFKETCRFCKEPNHVPLRCNEVEKADEVKMRTYIEDKMTEALLRQCWKCQRRFMKSEGCNKMTCVCGASMCYVCRQPIKDYTHFQNGKCAQNSNTEIMHQNEVITGGEKAKKEYLEQHPELENVTLKHDPMKDLPNANDNGGGDDHNWGEGDEDDDDEYEYDERSVYSESEDTSLEFGHEDDSDYDDAGFELVYAENTDELTTDSSNCDTDMRFHTIQGNQNSFNGEGVGYHSDHGSQEENIRTDDQDALTGDGVRYDSDHESQEENIHTDEQDSFTGEGAWNHSDRDSLEENIHTEDQDSLSIEGFWHHFDFGSQEESIHTDDQDSFNGEDARYHSDHDSREENIHTDDQDSFSGDSVENHSDRDPLNNFSTYDSVSLSDFSDEVVTDCDHYVSDGRVTENLDYEDLTEPVTDDHGYFGELSSEETVDSFVETSNDSSTDSFQYSNSGSRSSEGSYFSC